jgi:hypothetical protein
MHLLQSKEGTSGGPQYWLQDIEKWLANHLEKERACQIVLQTPYGITKTSFNLLHPDWKFGTHGKVKPANAQHYRVQADETNTSIGTAIQRWYGIKRKIKRIEVSVNIHDRYFILTPTRVTTSGADRAQTLERVNSPLSFHKDYQSKLWKRQIESCRKESSIDVDLAGSQIKHVVAGHRKGDVLNIHEADLLRTAGALSVLGVDLGIYLMKGYDCPGSHFCFSGLPAYPCPVEIKRRSLRFDYQITQYTDLPRVVVLCLEHDLVNPPERVDIVELSTLAEYLHS